MSKTFIKSVGIIVDHLNDHNLIQQLNNLVEHNSLYSPIIFTNDITLMVNLKPQFAIMQLVHAVGFKYPLISTNINTTKMLQSCCATTNKYFAVKTFEWNDTKVSNYSYEFLSSIYNNKDIKLISLNDKLTNHLSNIWKPPACTLHDWDYQNLITLLDKTYEAN